MDAPVLLAELAALAEDSGWDGVFARTTSPSPIGSTPTTSG
jgi:hypothetical protein